MNNLKKIALLSAGLFLLGCSNPETEEPVSSTTDEAALSEAESESSQTESETTNNSSNESAEDSEDSENTNENEEDSNSENSEDAQESGEESDQGSANNSETSTNQATATETGQEEGGEASEAQTEAELPAEEADVIEKIVAADPDLSNDYENYLFMVSQEGEEYKVEIRENTTTEVAPMVGIYYYNTETGQVDRVGVTGEREAL